MSTPTREADLSQERTERPAWASLPPAAKGYRVAHAAWAVAALMALGYVWVSAARRQRDRYLAMCLVFLGVQGVGLIAGRGNCPLGPFQQRLGDPAPLFELVLPPRAARAAIPVLTGVVVGALVSLVLRPPRQRLASR